jgi:hypothetical protein
MPYPCIITLLQYFISLFRPLPVPREITAKPCRQVKPGQLTCLLSCPGQPCIDYPWLLTWTMSTETTIQHFLLRDSVLSFSLKKETGNLTVLNNHMFPVWKAVNPQNSHTHTHTHTQTERQRERHRERDRERQRETETERDRDTHRDTHRHPSAIDRNHFDLWPFFIYLILFSAVTIFSSPQAVYECTDCLRWKCKFSFRKHEPRPYYLWSFP